MGQEMSRGELLAVIFFTIVGALWFLLGPGPVMRLIGMWIVVITALVFVWRSNGPLIREIRGRLRRNARS